MNMPVLSRRTLLMCGTAAVAFGGTLGAWVFSGTVKDYLSGLLAHTMGDEPFADGTIEAFVDEYVSTTAPYLVDRASKVARIARLIGIAGADRMLDSHHGYSELKQGFITNFLLQSNYFRRTDGAVPIEFFASTTTCPNPFARFDDL